VTTPPIDQPDWQNPQAGMAVVAPIASSALFTALVPIGPIDLSAYSSVIVSVQTVRTDGHLVNIVDPDDNATIASLGTPADAGGNTLPAYVIPVRSKRLTFTTDTLTPQTIVIIGSSRVVDQIQRYDRQADMDLFDLNAFAFAGTQTIGYGVGTGPGFLEFRLTNNAVKMFLQVTTHQGSMLITDTSEMHADPQGSLIIYKPWVAPAQLWRLETFTTTAGNSSFRFRSTYG
jgi:hypothetical protein